MDAVPGPNPHTHPPPAPARAFAGGASGTVRASAEPPGRAEAGPDSASTSSADGLLLREGLRLLDWVPAGGGRGAGSPARRRPGTAAKPRSRGPASSRFRGVGKIKDKQTKPWVAQIVVTEDGKYRRIYVGRFAREEDAARAFDRVSIAARGHAEAKTSFPVAEYRAEWARLEALGLEGAVARERNWMM